MSRLDELFADYASYHGTAGNRICHRIGIPLILISLLGLLSRLVVPGTNGWVDGAMILILVSELFYLRLDWRYGLAMLVISLLAWWAGRQMSVAANLALFVLGWVLQFIGHGVYEKKAPAFARNLIHLLVGPIWILSGLFPRSRAVETTN